MNQNTTYTPPVLPEHVPFVLDPVTGPPSDHQLKAVHAAWRFSESLAPVPSMFDPDLSMRLSQHLFDIQFERYLRHAVSNNRLDQATDSPVDLPHRSDPSEDDDKPHDPQGNSDVTERKFDQDALSTTIPAAEPLGELVATPKLVTQGITERPESSQHEPESGSGGCMKSGPEDTNKLLVRIEGVLENMSRILISTQHSMARGFNGTRYTAGYVQCHSHTFINAQGEDPEHSGLPGPRSLIGELQNWGSEHDTTLARYLEFYGLGSEYVESGSEPKIKEGKRNEAKGRLGGYLNVW
ncbi:hypothetical protein FRC06_007952 [Ceratobasidium sp. 370]|nr:hypothetical protein FRC06_007952 [Ceratobasidium sp. 370]